MCTISCTDFNTMTHQWHEKPGLNSTEDWIPQPSCIEEKENPSSGNDTFIENERVTLKGQQRNERIGKEVNIFTLNEHSL